MMVVALREGDQYAYLACEALKIVREKDPDFFNDTVEVLASFPDKVSHLTFFSAQPGHSLVIIHLLGPNFTGVMILHVFVV